MSEVFRFPNGYDVKVLRKDDVISRINNNNIDKELLSLIITDCEESAIDYLKEGRWAGIPFIGNIRIPKIVESLTSEESKAILDGAKQQLELEKYNAFKTAYIKDKAIQVKVERYNNYVLSKLITKNEKLYKRLIKEYGELYTKILFSTLINLEVVSTNE